MLLTRKKLRLLLYEMLLLERRATKQDLIGKIRYLDAYSSYLDKLNPKYYNKLDELIAEYDIEGSASVAHGVIIFILTMHQKYASTNVLPREFKDFNQINLENLKNAIEKTAAHYTDSRLYKELLNLDKSQTDKKLADDKKEEESNRKAVSKVKINQEVRPHLFLLGIVNGWQILKPTKAEGSEAFGVVDWCTVGNNAFDGYENAGITLYYLCKDGKDYDEKGYGFDFRENPYDYLSIGFEGQKLVVPSKSYGTSVWGNQVGVTEENLKKHMGWLSYQKIKKLIVRHFELNYGSSEHDAQFIEQKEARDKATIVRAFSSLVLPKSSDDIYKQILDCLNHPSLSDEVMVYLYQNFYLKINSKMKKSEAYASGRYKIDLLLGFLNMHATPTDLIKNGLAFDVLENYTEVLRRSFNIESLKNSSLWSLELSVDVYEKLFDMLEINKIQTFDSPAGDWNSKIDAHLFDIFLEIISPSEISQHGKNIASAIKMLENKYNLGALDELINVYINFEKSSRGSRQINTFNTRVALFMKILEVMEISSHTSDRFKQDMLNQKIDYTLNKASDDELKYSGNPYEIYDDIDSINSNKLIELGNRAQRLLRIFSHGSAQGAYRSGAIITNALEDKRETPNKLKLVKLLKEYIFIHNQFCQLAKDLGVNFEVKSDIYGTIASATAKLPPEEMRSLLDDLGGITRDNNDFYFIGKLVDANSRKSSTIEHKVEVFDLVQDMLNKYSEQGPIDNNDKNIKYRLSKLVYGGYNGGTKGNNAKLCYSLLKQQPEIFFTCAEYFYRYADSYDGSHFRDEWQKILNSLVSEGAITYEQALADVKYINEKFYERATKFADNEYQLKDFQRGILYPQRIVNPNEIVEDDEDDF